MRIGPILAGLGAGAKSLQASNELQRKQTLEEAMRARQERRDAAEAESRRLEDALTKARTDDIMQPAAPPVRNIDPLSPEGIRATGERARTIDTAVRSRPPAPAQARRQAEDDAMSAVRASGGDVAKAEMLLAKDPKSPWGRESMETRVRLLKAAGDRYEREKRTDAMRSSFGGVLGGLMQQGAAPPQPPSPPVPPAPGADAELTDDEIRDAMANGAETEEAVRAYIMKKRGGGV